MPCEKWESWRSNRRGQQEIEKQKPATDQPECFPTQVRSKERTRTWAALYSGGHVRCATSHALGEGAPPNFFHHIFLVRSSQTCLAIAAKISRQWTIEKCQSQETSPFPVSNFSPPFDNTWPRSAPPQVYAKQ
jgi:hypothetical protein